MIYNEEEETEVGFKVGADEDEIGEPLEIPELADDEDNDPESKFH